MTLLGVGQLPARYDNLPFKNIISIFSVRGVRLAGTKINTRTRLRLTKQGCRKFGVVENSGSTTLT